MTKIIFVGIITAITLISVIMIMTSTSLTVSAQGAVPEWIKTNAGWWSEDKISTDSYVTSLEWLINERIITVAKAQETDKASIDDVWTTINNLQTQVERIQTGRVDTQESTKSVGGMVPIGTVLAWAGSPLSIPSGFLIADGSAISLTDYRELFAVIGTTYGPDLRVTIPTVNPDFNLGPQPLVNIQPGIGGESVFYLPDLRDTFIRGTDRMPGVTGGTVAHDHTVDPPVVVIGGGRHAHDVNPAATNSGTPSERRSVGPCLDPGSVFCSTSGEKNHVHIVDIPNTKTTFTSHSHNVDIGPHPTKTAGNEPPFLSLVMIIRAK